MSLHPETKRYLSGLKEGSEWELIGSFPVYHEGRIGVVHGDAVECAGQGWLILGASEAGKTSVCRALAHTGSARTVADDYSTIYFAADGLFLATNPGSGSSVKRVFRSLQSETATFLKISAIFELEGKADRKLCGECIAGCNEEVLNRWARSFVVHEKDALPIANLLKASAAGVPWFMVGRYGRFNDRMAAIAREMAFIATKSRPGERTPTRLVLPLPLEGLYTSTHPTRVRSK